MSSGNNHGTPCAFSCPPSMVTIQPPPFVLTIPGPTIHCPEQPVLFEQRNPCIGNNARPPLPANRGPSPFPALPSSSFSYSIYRY